MGLYGTGMLMTFTEVAPEDEDEYNEWYNREHIAERVATEGSAVASAVLRAVSDDDVRDLIADLARSHVIEPEWGPAAGAWLGRIVETGTVQDLADPDYMARLAVQSEWSQKVMAGFTKFDRLTADITIDQTHGVCGWLGVTRLFPEEGMRDRLRESLKTAVLPELGKRLNMLGGCLAENNIDVSNAGLVAQGKPVPPGQTPEWVVLLDGATEAAVRDANDGLAEALEDAGIDAVSLDRTIYGFLFGNNR